MTTAATEEPPKSAPGDEDGRGDDARGETELQRLDRNTSELLTEVRVAAVGIQVLFAFLLIVPFNTGWKSVTSFDRYDYFVTLLLIAGATALLLAPSIHHRILFRQHRKPYLVELGSKLLIAAMVLLTLGLSGILVLISNFVFGGLTAALVGAIAGASIGWLWFVVPLRHRSDFKHKGD
jgi:Family of unknown function (DUF6328)